MTVIFFRGGRTEIEALPPVAGESYGDGSGYGPAEADLWAAADPEGYADAMRAAWTERATAGQCPHCGAAAQGRGLTCGADACTEWYANVVPVMEALRLTELRLQHQQPEPVAWRESWPVAFMAGSAGGLVAAVAFAVGEMQRWWA